MLSLVQLSMLWACLCFSYSRPSHSTVSSFISAIEQQVSNSARNRVFLSPRCINISITRRVPLSGFRCFLDGVPALGSSFLRFLDAPHISKDALGCSGSLPPKNPSLIPTGERWRLFPWCRQLLPSVFWPAGSPSVLLTPPISSSFLQLRLIPSKVRSAAEFLLWY